MNIFDRRQTRGVLLSATCVALVAAWILSRRRAKERWLLPPQVQAASSRRLLKVSEQVEVMIDHMMQDSFPASDPPVWDCLRRREAGR